MSLDWSDQFTIIDLTSLQYELELVFTLLEGKQQTMDFENQPLSRRTVLAGAASAAVLAATGTVAAALGTPAIATRQFPKNFRWGVATAAHQIEGNNLNADYWLLENVEPTAFKERSGDACDSYHRYEEDIALLTGHGFNSYRFSLEWARIEPTRLPPS